MGKWLLPFAKGDREGFFSGLRLDTIGRADYNGYANVALPVIVTLCGWEKKGVMFR